MILKDLGAIRSYDYAKRVSIAYTVIDTLWLCNCYNRAKSFVINELQRLHVAGTLGIWYALYSIVICCCAMRGGKVVTWQTSKIYILLQSCRSLYTGGSSITYEFRVVYTLSRQAHDKTHGIVPAWGPNNILVYVCRYPYMGRMLRQLACMDIIQWFRWGHNIMYASSRHYKIT